MRLTRSWLMLLCLLALTIASADVRADASADADADANSDAGAGEAVQLETVHRFQFTDEASSATELSGITWVEGDRYLAVSDKHDRIYPLRITLDMASGAIEDIEVGPSVTLLRDDGRPLGRTDLEGVAYDRRTNTVLTADELGPTLREHQPDTGTLLRELTPSSHPDLRVFARIRTNLAWESLTLTPDGRHVWTANEESLRNDGPRSTPDAGTLVRLQRLTRDLEPVGQWAYRTDPLPGRITFPPRFARREAAGVSELLALDDGRLLALERHFGGTDAGLAHFRIRIYEIDFTDATDTTDIDRFFDLADDEINTVAKRLVWETISYAPIDNLEGMTLGPELDTGDRAVLLIGDNNGGHTHALYALRLLRP
ncbi:esterase-like activity of phytase family protein [Phycisphaerales bacterium AB-hyl4]|uniref:Esterase-like activity of phytase family protein n=1 Tax=Natronomicrosphaera hydrolytica TaxID=3242702 RepID=A0ABV4U646_9BACT